MTRRKIEKGSCVLVIWNDAQTIPNWTNEDVFVEQELPEVKTVGVWAGSTKAHIAIAQNMVDGECDGIRIPWGWIRSIKVIRKPKKGQ
jgi:hypothetical protein